MLKILFFTQNRWAFGSIHHGLCKELYKHDIYSNVLDWTQHYSDEEYRLLNKTYDIFVTNPEAVLHLHYRGISLKKIITIAHGQWDILLAKKDSGLDFLNEVKDFAVISKILKIKSNEFGVSRIPKITPIGIHFDTFYSTPSTQLTNVGYSGMKETKNFFGIDIKRGHLVEQAVTDLDRLNLVFHGNYNHLCMPAYYQTIDCIVQSSSEEAGGLPAMEGAAAGKLIIGTPVGYLEENGNKGAGIVVPIDEEQFVQQVKHNLIYFRDNPQAYIQQCQNIQQFAKENYDWAVVIDNWIELFTGK